jgi:hypothetical protein
MSNKAKAILAKFESVLDSSPSVSSTWDTVDETCQSAQSRKQAKLAFEAQSREIVHENGRFVDLNV